MEYITRKSMLYRNGLGFFCINHVQDCHHGCRTYIHIKPYPTPNFSEQDLEYLLKAVEFVDSIYFNGWNYNSRVSEYKNYRVFYREQAALVKYFYTERGIQYDIGV